MATSTRPTIVECPLYASLAWRGFINSNDREKMKHSMRRLNEVGFLRATDGNG